MIYRKRFLNTISASASLYKLQLALVNAAHDEIPNIDDAILLSSHVAGCKCPLIKS